MSDVKYVYSLREGDGEQKLLLGGKGANLCRMVQSGLLSLRVLSSPPRSAVST